MVVTVDQIREGGLSLDETLSESFLTHALAEVKDTGFRPDGPALLHVKLQKTGSGVLLRGSTEVAVQTPCGVTAGLELELEGARVRHLTRSGS